MGYGYWISAFEWTNAHYVDYLNAVDPQGVNPNNIYNPNMTAHVIGGIIRIDSAATGRKYATKPHMSDKPVNYVSWYDAARVANWLHNGSPSSVVSDSSATAPQNHGAYAVGTSVSGVPPTKTPGAKYWIPSIDEWYKAAFYKGGGKEAGYWVYATQSDVPPSPVTASVDGVGSAGPVGNYANTQRWADWNGMDGNVTSVGTNGSPSYYGTFDMDGNVVEWTDTRSGSYMYYMGGYYGSDYPWGTLAYSLDWPNNDISRAIGFRLATSVPEIDPACAGSVMAVVVWACGLVERLRRRSA